MTGSFNGGGNPTLKIKVWGVLTNNAVEIEVMLDTGFSGFLTLPLQTALPLGLILLSTAEYVLADNTKQLNLLCHGSIGFDSENVSGLIAISPGDPLLGMEFLRKSGLHLSLDAANSAFLLEKAPAKATK
jgi:clan AA aspartic protease